MNKEADGGSLALIDFLSSNERVLLAFTFDPCPRLEVFGNNAICRPALFYSHSAGRLNMSPRVPLKLAKC